MLISPRLCKPNFKDDFQVFTHVMILLLPKPWLLHVEIHKVAVSITQQTTSLQLVVLRFFLAIICVLG